jgi:hypothetical protein
MIFQEDQIGLVDDEVTTEDSETLALSQEPVGVTADKNEVLGQEMATSPKDHKLSLTPYLGTNRVQKLQQEAERKRSA